RPQIAGRPLGLLLGLQSFHALRDRPTYAGLAHLPLDELVTRLRDPDVRKRILSEAPVQDERMSFVGLGLDRTFRLGNPPDYQPVPDDSVAAQARRDGIDPWELYYDLLLGDDGHELLLRPLLGYSNFHQQHIRGRVLHRAGPRGPGH